MKYEKNLEIGKKMAVEKMSSKKIFKVLETFIENKGIECKFVYDSKCKIGRAFLYRNISENSEFFAMLSFSKIYHDIYYYNLNNTISRMEFFDKASLIYILMRLSYIDHW